MLELILNVVIAVIIATISITVISLIIRAILYDVGTLMQYLLLIALTILTWNAF